jgi:Tfp pilus assembly protein PilF
LYVQQHRAADALPYLTEAHRLRSDDYSGGFDLAVAQLASGKLSEAAALIRELSTKSDRAELHSLLGTVYEKQGNYQAAVSELESAARLDPNESNIFGYGAEFLRHQTAEPAVKIFQHGLALYPRSWKLHAGLGLALQIGGDNDRAAGEFCAAIDMAPSEPLVYPLLAAVYDMSPPALAEASIRFERYAAREPENAQALYFYAVSLWRQSGESDPDGKVESLLKRSVALDPKFAMAHLQLGIVYARHSKHAEAADQLRQAVQSRPDLAVAHYRLGETLIRQGDPASGKRELEIWRKLRSEEARNEQMGVKLPQFLYDTPGTLNAKP